jgi:hypothetical protein
MSVLKKEEFIKEETKVKEQQRNPKKKNVAVVVVGDSQSGENELIQALSDQHKDNDEFTLTIENINRIKSREINSKKPQVILFCVDLSRLTTSSFAVESVYLFTIKMHCPSSKIIVVGTNADSKNPSADKAIKQLRTRYIEASGEEGAKAVLNEIGKSISVLEEMAISRIKKEIEHALRFITNDDGKKLTEEEKDKFIIKLDSISEIEILQKESKNLFDKTRNQLMGKLNKLKGINDPIDKRRAQFNNVLTDLEQNLDDPDELKKAIERFMNNCKKYTNNSPSRAFVKALCSFLAAAVIFGLLMAAGAGIASLTGVVGWSLLIAGIAAVAAGVVAGVTANSFFPKNQMQKEILPEAEHLAEVAEIHLNY